MAVNPKSLDNLSDKYQFKPKWQSGKTKLIRVPEKIADQVLEVAHDIDNGISPNRNSQENNSELLMKLMAILEKIDNKEKGYKSNGSGQLIKDIRALLKDDS